MSGNTNAIRSTGGRRSARHEQTRAEIIAAAWDLARAHGLAGLSMRELGARVGMRAQSVYSYISTKDEIYDAMFRQGYEQFLAHLSAGDGGVAGDGAPDAGGPVARLRTMAHRYFTFCTDDPVRYQLMFQRTIPGFEPSPESYAVAVDALGRMAADLRAAGIDDPDALDVATALLTGLTSQQLSNDPGGRRWQRLVDPAVDMFLAAYGPPPGRPAASATDPPHTPPHPTAQPPEETRHDNDAE